MNPNEYVDHVQSDRSRWWSDTVPGVYRVPLDSLFDVDVHVEHDSISGVVVTLFDAELSAAEARQLAAVLTRAAEIATPREVDGVQVHGAKDGA